MQQTLKFLKEWVHFQRLSRKPKRRVSLLIKCTAAIIVIQTAVMFAMGYRAALTLTELRTFLLDEHRTRINSLSKLLSNTAFGAILNNDFRVLQGLVDETVLDENNKMIHQVTIFNVQGEVVAEQKRSLIGEKHLWTSSLPISYNGVHFGQVEIHSSLDSIYASIERLLYFWSIIFVVATLVSSLLVSASIYFLFFVPIGEFRRKIHQIEKGDLTQRIDITTGDELGNLGKHFDKMTEALQAKVEDLTKAQNRLKQLLERLGETFSSTLDLEKLVDAVAHITTDTLRASTAILMLVNRSGDELCVKAAEGLNADKVLHYKVKVGESAVGRVAKNGKPLLIPDSSEGGAIGLNLAGVKEKHSSMVVPLFARGAVLGVLSVYGGEQTYSEKDLEALQWLAGQAAVAIDNALLHQEIERLAEVDSLTQLYNHRYLLKKLESELKRSERFSHPLTCLMLDIDDFKNFNDTYGHLAGDVILKEVGSAIRKNIREIDIPARYGGEEFIILLPETEKPLGTLAAERIRNAFESSQFLVGGDKIPIRLSVTLGVATYPEDGQTPDDLIQQADAAMYQGKRSGKNKVIAAKGVLLKG